MALDTTWGPVGGLRRRGGREMASGQHGQEGQRGNGPRPDVPPNPRPPEIFIPRPRLDEFLDGVPATPVNLVVAPAGSGKTVAVAAWSDRVGSAEPPVVVAWTRGDRPEAIAELVEAMRCPDHDDGPDVLVVDDAHLMPEQSQTLLAGVV